MKSILYRCVRRRMSFSVQMSEIGCAQAKKFEKKIIERGCQPNILCRLSSDESCSASCSKQLAWFISKALDKRNECIQGTNTVA